MNSKLLRHLGSPEERQKFSERLKHNSDMLEVFVSLIQEEREKSYKRQHDNTWYENSGNWPYMQADAIGEQRAFDTVIGLLTVS